MKKKIHPKYQKILFVDSSTGHKFVCGAAMDPEEKDTFEGVEYPVCRVSISSQSHPLFTGKSGLVDTEGRIDKFKKRYEAKRQSAKKQVEAAKEAEVTAKKKPVKKKT
jgi:large subunit ribosomal protein L31